MRLKSRSLQTRLENILSVDPDWSDKLRTFISTILYNLAQLPALAHTDTVP